MSAEPPAGDRRIIEPDPAWDAYDIEDEVLTVELSWRPDALAARMPEVVASPALVEALESHGVTGYRTGPAVGVYNEDALEMEPDPTPPQLVRLIIGADPTGDLADLPVGLTASPRALAVLLAHCERLQVGDLG